MTQRKAFLGFFQALITALPVLSWSGASFADYQLNLPKGVTAFGEQVYSLHMAVLWVCVAISVVVYGVMFYSLVRFRKSKGAVPAKFEHNTRAEILWTVIPVVILVALAVPATRTFLFLEKAPETEMTVKITGYQWKWKYDYPGEGISFFSNMTEGSRELSAFQTNKDVTKQENYLLEVDNPLVIPVDTKILFLTTANDVIHSWWVPAFLWKRDAIPGFVNQTWSSVKETGIYRGQCAELCGKGHAFMPIVVRVVSKPEYAAWLGEMRSAGIAKSAAESADYTAEELVAMGKGIYQKNCVACHGPEGKGVPNVFPALAGGAITTGPLNEHITQVMKGVRMMPAFAGQLSDLEIASVIAYERNAWGNAERVKAAGHVSFANVADIEAERAKQ